MQDSKSLVFTNTAYIQRFGSELGSSLFVKIQKILNSCKDNSIPFDSIQMGICKVIWEQFGVQWLDLFSCIQLPRKKSPEQGVDDFCVLYA